MICHVTYQDVCKTKMYIKLRWPNQHCPDHEANTEVDNPNSIHAFNRFGEGHIEHLQCQFKLIGLTQEDLYTIEVAVMMMKCKF